MAHPGIRATQTTLFGLIFSAIGGGALAQSVPDGFVDEPVPVAIPESCAPLPSPCQLSNPTAFTVLPDGRLLVAEKRGSVRVISQGQLLPAPFIDLRSSVNDYWDRGLLGIAADLHFATNGYVYLFYTHENDPDDYAGSKTGRLTRVTAVGDVASPQTAVTILGTSVGTSCDNLPSGTDCLPADEPSHTVGNVRVASDGTLFLTQGDGASFNVVDDRSLRALDLNSLAGKVLHITTTGDGVSNNPFWNGDAGANRSKVWAYGLRNPYRLAVHPTSGIPFVGDVGWNVWEEVNISTAGKNLGWPCFDGIYRHYGFASNPQCQALYALGPVEVADVIYDHHQLSSAVTAGVFYTGTAFPPIYRGAFFYADYALGFMRYFQVSPTGAMAGPVTGFGSSLPGPVYIDTDGTNLLYVAINTGQIRRIRYVGPEFKYLSDIPWTAEFNGFGPTERDQSNGADQAADGRVLSLGGTTYGKGLGVHAPSDIRYPLGGTCSVFNAAVGVDEEVGSSGRVVFQVWADGIQLYDSGALTGNSATGNVNVDVSGRGELRLIVTDGGDGTDSDSADWANARLTCNDVTAPAPSAVSPAAGSTGVALGVNLTATFSEAMDAATITTATFILTPTTSAAVTYDAASKRATLNPTTDLAPHTFYTATVRGGTGGARDLAGNPLVVDTVWTFTTADGDITPPEVTDVSPPDGTGGLTAAVKVSALFSEALNPATVTVQTVTLRQGGTSVAAAVTYDPTANVLTLNASAPLTANTTYTARIAGGSNGVRDMAGNPLTHDRVWTFTTAVGSSYLSDLPFSANANGWGPLERDRSNGENLAGDGGPLTVNGVTYEKGLGAHAASSVSYVMGGACTTFSAVVGLDDEVGAFGSVVFQVWIDGTKRYDSGQMTGTTPGRSVYVSATGGNQLLLLMIDSGDGIAADHGDWADAQVACSDSVPPTVTATVPAGGATNVAATSNVTATFSEAIAASTVSAETVTLMQGAIPIAATVSYTAATSTITIDPISTLVAGTIYTVTIKGGSAGVRDLAGNLLAADVIWVFQTNASPVATISLPLSTQSWQVGDVITYAGSATDSEDGVLTGASLTWSVVLYHCPASDCHTHPFVASTGSTGMFTAPDHGDDSYFQINLSASDTGGLIGTASVVVQPREVNLTLETSPAGLQVVYGGTTATAPVTFRAIAGSTHTILAPSPQGAATFVSWSDGGAQQHNTTVGASDATYIAAFTGGDASAPTVTAMTPPAAAAGVPTVGNVSASFSAVMDPATVADTTVTLAQGTSRSPRR